MLSTSEIKFCRRKPPSLDLTRLKAARKNHCSTEATISWSVARFGAAQFEVFESHSRIVLGRAAKRSIDGNGGSAPKFEETSRRMSKVLRFVVDDWLLSVGIIIEGSDGSRLGSLGKRRSVLKSASLRTVSSLHHIRLNLSEVSYVSNSFSASSEHF
jgi:hypothetical protein